MARFIAHLNLGTRLGLRVETCAGQVVKWRCGMCNTWPQPGGRQRRRCLHLLWPDLLADNVFILLYEVKRMQAPTRPRPSSQPSRLVLMHICRLICLNLRSTCFVVGK